MVELLASTTLRAGLIGSDALTLLLDGGLGISKSDLECRLRRVAATVCVITLAIAGVVAYLNDQSRYNS